MGFEEIKTGFLHRWESSKYSLFMEKTHCCIDIQYSQTRSLKNSF